MTIKVLYENNNITFNYEEIASDIKGTKSEEDLDNLITEFSSFLKAFKDKISELAEHFYEMADEQRIYINNNSNSMNNGLGSKIHTMTPPANGVRRVKHSDLPPSVGGYDNLGFVPVKVLVICSIVATLIMYGILIVANLK